MAAALVFTAYAVFLGLLIAVTSSAGKADDRESRLIRLSLRALGDSSLEADRRRHHARCDKHARRPGYVEIPPSASRRGAA